LSSRSLGDGPKKAIENDEAGEIADNGDIDKLRSYVARGGSVDRKNADGETMVQIAVLNEDLEFLEECVKLGASLSGALHYAGQFNKVDSANWLLAHGANPNEPDAQGRVPLELAAPIIGVHRILVSAQRSLCRNPEETG